MVENGSHARIEVIFPRTGISRVHPCQHRGCFNSHLTRHKQASSPRSTMLKIQQLALPAVWTLIGFLALTSQYFFLRFELAPLRDDELWKINIFAACIGICYYRTCTVDPGRVPKDWKPSDQKHLEGVNGRQRWCRKCEAFKPPRAHHCRTCGRYVMLP